MKISEINDALKRIKILREAIAVIDGLPNQEVIPDVSWKKLNDPNVRRVGENAAMKVLGDHLTVASFRTEVKQKLQAKLTLLENKFPFIIEEG